MKNAENVSRKPWQFPQGNKAAAGHGRPRGSRRELRDLLAGRKPLDDFKAAILADWERAKQGNLKALHRVVEVVTAFESAVK